MAILVSIEDHTGNVARHVKMDETTTIDQLTPTIITSLKLPITDPAGQPITYHLAHNSRRLQDNETLTSAEVRDGDTITIEPEMWAAELTEGKNDAIDIRIVEKNYGINIQEIAKKGVEASRGRDYLLRTDSTLLKARLDTTVPIEALIPALVNRLESPATSPQEEPSTYYLSFDGRRLPLNETLKSLNIPEDSVLTLIRQVIIKGGRDYGDQISLRQFNASTLPYFLISYHGTDSSWAQWIAAQLESPEYVTILHDCEKRPEDDYRLMMNAAMEAAEAAKNIIAVLSPDYLRSLFAQVQWQIAFGRDPAGEQALLLPVHVRECGSELTGYLASLPYIDFVDTNKSQARERLLSGIRHPQTLKRPKKNAAIVAPPGFTLVHTLGRHR